MASTKGGSKTVVVTVGGTDFSVTNILPKVPSAERQDRQRDIEKRLYEIFAQSNTKQTPKADEIAL